MAEQNYIGINGVVTQDLNSILSELENKFKSIYGDNINLEQNSPDGQWLNILAQEKIDTLDFITQLYNSLDVDSVVGLPQQVLYKLNGLEIKSYTYSYVYVDIYVTQTVTLNGLDGDIASIDGTGYTVTDINGNNWILAETTTIVESEEPTLLLFRAQELGQITALANTITTMSTVVAGVDSVNNPANNFITGQTGESAAEFRTRRNRSMQAPSQGFKESIEGQLLSLNDVSDAKVYDSKDNPKINGVQVIVQGGTSEEIGNIIYNNLPPGINTQGAYSANITVNGREKELNYDKPNPIPIYVRGTIESLTGYPNDIDLNYVKERLASIPFQIGQKAESAVITSELKDILGDTGSPYDIEMSLSAGGGKWTDFVTIYDGNSSNGYVGRPQGFAYVNNTYFINGVNGYILYSEDLENLNRIKLTLSTSNGVFSIAYGNNIYVAVFGNKDVATSSDGKNWDVKYDINIQISDVIFINYEFVGVGDKKIYSSTDGVNWTTKKTFDSYPSFRKICYGNDKYVIAGEYLSSSTDLINWTTPYKPPILSTNNSMYDICYGDKGFVACGYKGAVATSIDGENWTTQQVGNNEWKSISYSNGLYIMVSSKNVATSTDLINWTITDVVDTSYDNNYYNYYIVSKDDTFIMIGCNLTNNDLRYTTYTIPNESWQEILTPSGLADHFVITTDGLEDLTVLGAD